MIVTLSPRSISATDFLRAALPQQKDRDQPLNGAVLGRWPRLSGQISAAELRAWTIQEWAEFFEDPLLSHPFAAHPDGDRRAVFHLSVQLHPADLELRNVDWAHIDMHLAHISGITDADGDGPHRWLALQAQPGRLDLIANLIHNDTGAWARQPRYLQQHLNRAAHNLEDWLDLTSTRPLAPDGSPANVVVNWETGRGITLTVTAIEPAPLVAAVLSSTGFHRGPDGLYTPAESDQDPARAVRILHDAKIAVHLTPEALRNPALSAAMPASTQLPLVASGISTDSVPSQVAEVLHEQIEQLMRSRRLMETTATWAHARTDSGSTDRAHRLEWIARRLYSIEEDVRAVTNGLTATPGTARRPTTTAPGPAPAAVVPATGTALGTPKQR